MDCGPTKKIISSISSRRLLLRFFSFSCFSDSLKLLSTWSLSFKTINEANCLNFVVCLSLTSFGVIQEKSFSSSRCSNFDEKRCFRFDSFCGFVDQLGSPAGSNFDLTQFDF